MAHAGVLIKSPTFKARLRKYAVPISIALGMVMVSTSFAIHTAKQHLKYAPDVFVKKSRRQTIPEVVEPEKVVEDSEKYIKKSLFRKVAHIQDTNKSATIPIPIHGDILTKEPSVVSLKDIGVDPKLQ